jgi:YidC/Oxa1 family membrane protein insertase
MGVVNVMNNLIAGVFVIAEAANPGLWGSFVNFLANVLQLINNITNNYGLSVMLFTILMRLVLLPLDLKAKASTKKINELQPLLKEINEKYKYDPDKRNRKTAELYQKHGVNPLGGCLPLLIQIPIFFALFAALRQISSMELGSFLIDVIKHHDPSIIPVLDQITKAVESSSAIKQRMVDIIPQLFIRTDLPIVDQMKEIAGAENVSLLLETIKNISNKEIYSFLNAQYGAYRFLWIKNVWIADSPLVSVVGRPIDLFSNEWNGLFILPILAGVTSYYQTKLASTSTANQQTGGFTAIFPILSVWFTAMYTAVFGVYWVTNNIFQIVQQIVYNRTNSPEGEGVKP